MKQVANNENSKWLFLLGMLFVVVNTSADILAYKMVHINHLLMSVGVFIVPISYAISDVITEVYGYKVSRQIIWFGLLSELIFDLICYFSSLAKSPEFINNDLAFNIILKPLLHIYMAVLIASITSDFINVYCISKWKILMSGRYFWLRSIGSSIIAQFLFTAICDGIVFYSKLSGHLVAQTIVSTFFIKICCTLFLSIPVSIIVIILKKIQKIDIFDYGINFNPFKL